MRQVKLQLMTSSRGKAGFLRQDTAPGSYFMRKCQTIKRGLKAQKHSLA